jgi:hypothetical protein
MTNILPKTRVIPISDFYTRLQLEFISYRFRSMIYQRPFDRKKFEDICSKKKEKIDQIALENCLPSVFNDKGQRERYLRKFFKIEGIPSFCYRDDYQMKVKGHWDIFYYFIVGSSVRYRDNGDVCIGRIKHCNTALKKIVIEADGCVYERTYDDVTRIFPSNFYTDFFL